MTTKISCQNVYKVFGPNPMRGVELAQKGVHKEDILKQTGLTVGVNDASFDIEEGEIFVIMGLSGSGKSTMVRMLNRLIEPTSGKVEVDGEDILQYSQQQLVSLRRNEMSMVFQSFALMPHLKVWENAAFGKAVAGRGKDERYDAALKALEQVGLKGWEHSRVNQLSGGMQQRVGLARALAVAPSILLMDEAFSALDPLIRTEMQDELLKLQQKERRTVVFISHDLDEAFRIGDRIAIMEGGSVVQIGRPDEILKNPADEYVRSFFKGVDLSKVMSAGDIAKTEHYSLKLEEFDGLGTALQKLRDKGADFCFVRDSGDQFRGVISVASVTRAMEQHGESESVENAFLSGVSPVGTSASFDSMLRTAAESPSPLPVVDDNKKYIGAISRADLLETLDRTR